MEKGGKMRFFALKSTGEGRKRFVSLLKGLWRWNMRWEQRKSTKIAYETAEKVKICFKKHWEQQIKLFTLKKALRRGENGKIRFGKLCEHWKKLKFTQKGAEDREKSELASQSQSWTQAKDKIGFRKRWGQLEIQNLP